MYEKDYILFEIEYEDGMHYITTVKDAEGEYHYIPIIEEVYSVLLKSNRKIRNCASWDERHVEQSELTDETRYDRTFRKQKSVERIVIEKLRNEELWKAINKLKETQKRRIILYYFYELSYEKIAEFEFRTGMTQKRCSPQAIKASIDIAKKKLKKLLRKRL